MTEEHTAEALHEETRKIYERQHRRIAENDAVFDRIAQSYSAAKFGLDPRWFTGKVALDAGCGNIGALILKLAEMGCSEIHGCDIGTEWIPVLTEHMKSKGLTPPQFVLRSGNIVDLPYKDEQFDFVAVNGVLVHLRDMGEIETGFGEGARVCKKGGFYFTSWGPCGGLVQGRIMPAVRAHYREDVDFRALIDNISPPLIHGIIDKVCADSAKYGGQVLDGVFLKSLFGEDFCVFLQNFIQAPQWWSNECTPEYVEGLYKEHGFVKITRLNEFVKRSDIRKFFAPLHYDRDHPVSRGLYGRGYVKYIAQRA